MTHTSKELAANGVDPRAIEWRKWRRAQRLTIKDCAVLARVSVASISRWETGQTRHTLLNALDALMRDWHESKRPRRVIGKRGRKPKLKPIVSCR